MKSLLMYELKKFYYLNKILLLGIPVILIAAISGESYVHNQTVVWLYLLPFYILTMTFSIFGFQYDSFYFDGLCANSKDFIRNSIIVRYILTQIGYIISLLFLLLLCNNKNYIITTALFYFGIFNYIALSTFFLFKKRFDFCAKIPDTSGRNSSLLQYFIVYMVPMFSSYSLCILLDYYASLQKIIWGVLFVFGLLSIFWLNFVIKKTQKKRYELMEAFRE